MEKQLKIKNLKDTLFLVLVYPICLAILWGECFRSFHSNWVSCGIGFLLTFISAYFLQKERDFKIDWWKKLIIILIMAAYSSVFLFSDGLRVFLVSPFFWGLLFLIFNFFVFKELRKVQNNIFFVLITVLYTNSYFKPYYNFKNETEPLEKSVIIDETVDSTVKKQDIPDREIDISSFNFLNTDSKTVSIVTEQPYIFIETWNQDCYPCKVAIKELTPMLDSMRNRIDSYFIYEDKKYDHQTFVKSTKKIKEFSNFNVLADSKFEFFNSMKMNSYPTFLIIDTEQQEIKYMAVGYSRMQKRYLIEKLKEIQNEAH